MKQKRRVYMSSFASDPLFSRIRIRRLRQSRRMRLRIDEEGILLTAPLRAKDTAIEEFFFAHRDWIEENLSVVDEKLSCFSLREEEGSQWFLVEGYWVEVEEREGDVSWVDIVYLDTHLVVTYPKMLKNRGSLQERLLDWCAEKTIERAHEIMERYGSTLTKQPLSIRGSAAKTKWGSCSSKGVVHLHRRLFQLEPMALEYVVIHECAHLIHLNHSALFWGEVERLMPNYAQGKEKLLRREFPTKKRG